jgi:hypothetical protein
VCAFLHGTAHKVCQGHQAQQEIRGSDVDGLPLAKSNGDLLTHPASNGNTTLPFVIPSVDGRFGPPKVMKSTFRLATALCLATAPNESAALPFVIPRVCDFIGFFTFLTHLSLLFSASVFI